MPGSLARSKRAGAIVMLLLATLLVPLMSASRGNAAPTEGCIAVGFSTQYGYCAYLSSGGNVQVVVAGYNTVFSVHKGPPSNPYQETCGYGGGLGPTADTFKCYVPPGYMVTGEISTVGVLTIRARPPGL